MYISGQSGGETPVPIPNTEVKPATLGSAVGFPVAGPTLLILLLIL